MKLGVFDSGLGGIQMAKAIRAHIPDIDMVFLGDTLHLPYGNRSADSIYKYSKACVDFLFREQDCNLLIVACNTASASALRRLQQEYLIDQYPDRRVLGVVVPTIEHALEQGYERLGLIGTNFTVASNIYEEELLKLNADIKIYQQNTPLLVPLIEYDGGPWIKEVLAHYMKPLIKQNIQTLLLSCTHYACLKELIRETYNIDVISQDEIIPKKLEDYLRRHPEINEPILRQEESRFLVTDYTDNYARSAIDAYGQKIKLEHVKVHL